MRKTITRPLFPWLIAALLLSACQAATKSAPPQETPQAELIEPLQASWDDRTIFQNGLIASQRPILEQLPAASVYHIELEIEADLVHVTGREELRYTNQEGVPLDELVFHLYPNILGGALTIAALSVDGQPAAPSYALANSLMRVPLAPPLEAGGQVLVRMEFAVTAPTEAEANYGVLASSEGVLTLAHFYPLMAVYDEQGWSDAAPSPYGDLTYADAGFYLVKVTAPEHLVLVASGSEVGRKASAKNQVVAFAAGPGRDFYLAASKDYVKQTETVGEVTLNSYAPENLREGAQLALQAARRALEIFNERYGAYPYTEFDLAAAPILALGVEYPGMTTLNAALYDPDESFNGTPASIYLEATAAHEVGHQWFYNMVGSDQLNEPWLDESLTQYVTWQYYEDAYGAAGAAGFRQSLEGRWQSVERAEIPIGLPVSAYEDNEYASIVYGRGAFFFEALAQQMGAAAFDEFMKDYAQRYQWGIASGEALKGLAEEHCACDLTPLFQEWVYPSPSQ